MSSLDLALAEGCSQKNPHWWNTDEERLEQKEEGAISLVTSALALELYRNSAAQRCTQR